MFENARKSFSASVVRYPWVPQLAGILPLSTLIDFINVPQMLHIFELTGAVPLWCWPITPSGSRLLLSDREVEDTCCLDVFGSSQSIICLDGRFGDKYYAASPETLRLCLATVKPIQIPNDSPNMMREDKRPQRLQVVHVSRRAQSNTTVKRHARTFYAASLAGWVVLAGLLVLAIIMQCWLTLAFLIDVPLTGLIVFYLRSGNPRVLRVDHGSDFNRIVVATLHMNATNWMCFYGESTIVNSLLNRPLRRQREISRDHWVLGLALRLLILGQWAMAIAAAAIQEWDAFFITFWIMMCIFSHSYLFSPERSTTSWMKHFAQIHLEKFEVTLSSRRALLNTIMALNPDTFPYDLKTSQEKHDQLYSGALKWIDPILAQGPDRTRWQEATRLAMTEAAEKNSSQEKRLDSDEDTSSKSFEANYWYRFIGEGVDIATKIAERGQFKGRFVESKKPLS